MSEETVGNNGRLKIVEDKIKELEPRKNDKEVRKELTELYREKIKLTEAEKPKDFKIAEIWIKDDTVALDACPSYPNNRFRTIADF